MKISRKCLSIPLLPLILLLLTVSNVCALTGDEYTTPDSWSKHTTPNGVKSSSGGIKLGDSAILTMGLTTRYQLRYADDYDSDLYQYLRAYLTDVNVGAGKISMNVNMRVAGDFNDTNSRNGYDFFRDSLDSEMGSGDAAFRLYQANIVAEDFVKYTKLTLGRFYLDYLDSFKMDGGQLEVGTDEYKGYAFYGVPVSFYTKGLKTQAAGAGVDLKFPSNTRLRADGKYLFDDSVDFEDTTLIKARIDQKIPLGGRADMNIHVAGSMLNDVFLYDAGVIGNVLISKTTYNLWVKGQAEKNDEYVNPLVSDYDMVLGQQNPYTMFGVKVFQGVTKYFAVGAAFEGKINEKESYGQRDYWRVSGNIDFFGMIPDNYISFTVDYWDVSKNGMQQDNKRLFFGGRVTQVVMDTLDLWLGANLTNYRHHYQQIDLSDNAPIMYFDKKLDDNVYIAYLGGAWSPFEWLNVQADYMYEASQIIQYEDSKNDQAHYVELWLNFLF